jgi:CRISPR-associated endonuclease/helicase Cas3
LFREKNIYPESELIDLINKYYYALKDKSSQDESRKILDSIKALKYEDILSQFKLIEEIPSFLMFFEINKRATELLQTFRDILNIKDRYNRKNEFLKIKSQFYEYILSVKFSETTKSYFTSFEDIGNIKIVDNTIVDNIYDKNTGLKRAWSIFL